MTNAQMELGFANRACQFNTRRQRRLNRAAWWFERMRQVVDRAIDWDAVQPPPRQILLEENGQEIVE